MPRWGSAYRLISGRERPSRLCMTANDSGHEAGECSLKIRTVVAWGQDVVRPCAHPDMPPQKGLEF